MNQLSGVRKKDELIFIQKTLKKITNQDLDIKYIEKNYLKILFKLKFKKKIMVAGSQGSGKSSLSKLIKLYLEKFYNKSVVIISMDDFYLSKKQRTQLSKNIHPLFLTRGAPGTHDFELLNRKIMQIFDKEFPVYLPIFDKVTDTRKRTYRKVLKGDVIIFEGWCAGAQPVNQSYLQKNFNNLEKYEDKNFKMIPGASRIKLVENLLRKGLVKTDGKLSPKEFIKERIKKFNSLKGQEFFEAFYDDGGVDYVSTSRLPDGGTLQIVTDITKLKENEKNNALVFIPFDVVFSQWHSDCTFYDF